MIHKDDIYRMMRKANREESLDKPYIKGGPHKSKKAYKRKKMRKNEDYDSQ